ncbi:MAG: methyltransferase family protein [Luteibaculaceae bacterium]
MTALVPYILVLGYLTLAVELIFFPVKSQGSTYRLLKEKKVATLKSLVLLLTNALVIAIFLFPLLNLYLDWMEIKPYNWGIYLGALLLIVGRGISFGAMVQLRKNGYTLQTDTYFKWSRNPNIDGSLLFLVGISLLMGSPLYFGSAVMVFLYLLSRAQMEEEYLEAAFGQRYTDYKQKTPRTILLWLQKHR